MLVWYYFKCTEIFALETRLNTFCKNVEETLKNKFVLQSFLLKLSCNCGKLQPVVKLTLRTVTAHYLKKAFALKQ